MKDQPVEHAIACRNLDQRLTATGEPLMIAAEARQRVIHRR